jgi:hypothetical protein
MADTLFGLSCSQLISLFVRLGVVFSAGKQQQKCYCEPHPELFAELASKYRLFDTHPSVTGR